MSAQLVLNELSLDPASAPQVARDSMHQFLSVCNAAQGAGASRSLLVPEVALTSSISADYTLWEWANDPLVDLELRRKFISMSAYGPFTEDVISAINAEQLEVSDYFFDDRPASGLGVAHVMDGLAVSLAHNDVWRRPLLEFRLHVLSDDAELAELEDCVRHAALHDHVAGHKDWLSARQRAEVNSGADVWERRRELFPGLVFCERVEDQLRGIDRNDPHLRQVLRRLGQLNDCFAGWREGPFERSAIPDCDPESQVTLQRFAAQHSFLCPDGETRVFSWHVPITPGPWRLFFHPDGKRRNAVIGHIGAKLPNVSFVT